MSRSTQPDVLIVGAGPSGLALALLLSRNGLSVRIIDKQGNFNVGQRGAGIHARTLELYKLLGILPEVEQRSMKKIPSRKIYIPGQDKPVSETPPSDRIPTEPQYHRMSGTLFRQEDHQSLFREVLKNEYGVSVESLTELDSFTQDDDGVSVQLKREDQHEMARVKWLVGADGARSTVRKQLGLTFLGESHEDISMVVGEFVIENIGDVDGDSWSIWGNQKEKMVLLCPYFKNDGTQVAFFMLGGAQLPDIEEVSKSRENIISALRDITRKRTIEFGSLYTSSIWRANIRMANKFQEGRVFIVGDAAHVHSPTGAQGTNTSVQDSFNLAWKLALVHKGLAPHSLLETYTTERLPVIACMLQLTTELMKRDFAAKPSPEQWQRKFEDSQLGITYRGTRDILIDERYPTLEEKVDPYRSGLDGTVRAGDRAPEAPGLRRLGDDGGESISMFEFFSTTAHTVLLFANSISDVQDSLDLVAKYPKALINTLLVLPQAPALQSLTSTGSLHQILFDVEGHAYRNYRVQPGETLVAVVRPDGYIGALVTGAFGLNKYFGKVFV
ncbi:hypothetical protein VNI00_004233 [Paramarasmius palmivorus]|uniref:FAD-binding domain-containing protein n=1 Tax=Paramarasmius palmivorus TaxID=297713 RepID=A0AAW0DL28_9AGAR